MNIIKTKEVGDYRISVFYDESPSNPMKDWTLAGCYLYEWDRPRRLSDTCNWESVFGVYDNCNHTMRDALRMLVEEYIPFETLLIYIENGEMEDVRITHDMSSDLWVLEVYTQMPNRRCAEWHLLSEIEPADLYAKDYNVFYDLFDTLEVCDIVKLLNELGKDIFVAEWGSTGYSQGDYVNGIAFCTKERYEKHCGQSFEDWKRNALLCMKDEVKCITRWMWGDVLAYSVEKKVHFTKVYQDATRPSEECVEWEEISSCYDFHLDADELIEEVMLECNIIDVE